MLPDVHVTIHNHNHQRSLLLAQVRLVSQLQQRVLRQRRPVRRQVTTTIRVLHQVAPRGKLHLPVIRAQAPALRPLILVGHSLRHAQRPGPRLSHQAVLTQVADRLVHGLLLNRAALGHQPVRVLQLALAAHAVGVAADQAPQQVVAGHRVQAAAVDIAQAAHRAGHRALVQVVVAHRADRAPLLAGPAVAAVAVVDLAPVLLAAHQAAAGEVVAPVLAPALAVVDKQH